MRKPRYRIIEGDMFGDPAYIVDATVLPQDIVIRSKEIYKSANEWHEWFMQNSILASLLSPLTRKDSSGVYALYLKEEHEYYAPIVNTNIPIYVGKATCQPSYRKDADEATSLAKRIECHCKNIQAASNLDVSSFYYRCVPTDYFVELTIEANLIQYYAPAWNVCVEGFGRHGDKKRNNVSNWDVIHPGRKWAGQDNRKDDILKDLSVHFANLRMAAYLLFNQAKI